MLLATHGAFYKNVPVVDGTVRPSDEFGTLHFFDFPTPPQTLHVVLSLYITGEVRGMLSHRLRRWTDEVFHSQPIEVRFVLPDGFRNFTYVYDLPQVIFPRPGVYVVDVIFERAVLSDAALSIVQIK